MQWSIALSLPLGLFAILVLSVAPGLLGSTVGSGLLDGEPASISTLRLGLVWVFALFIQIVLTGLLFSIPRHGRWIRRPAAVARATVRRKPSNHVTLTIGGVWMAIPDLVQSRTESELSLDQDDSSDANDTLSDDGPSVLESFGGASRVLLLWSLVLLALGGATMGCLLVDTFTTASSAAAESVRMMDTVPTIALIDRPWIACGWMFCLQGFWQLLPIPQSLGRVGWSAAIGLLVRRGSDETIDYRVKAAQATRVVRWWVMGFAIAVSIIGVVAISRSGIDTRSGGQALPVFAGLTLLVLWLCVSIRSEDLLASQMVLAANGETGIFRSQSPLGVGIAWRRWQSARQERTQTKRLLEAIDRERSEASDAARVDGILRRLHASGQSSLSDEERAILGRVSQAIRRERERDKPVL